MLKEAIDRILGLSTPNVIEANEIEYVDKQVHMLMPPLPEALVVDTLAGFADAAKLEGGAVGDHIVHVDDHETVKFLRIPDQWGRRPIVVLAKVSKDGPKFPFDSYLEPEVFVIRLLTCFQTITADDDVAYLLRLASNLSSEVVNTAEDDGLAQRATVRKGVVRKEVETVRSKVVLRPYRTFRELTLQPSSEFLFRLRSRENAPPTCALFEADGGAWRIEAVKDIKEWLAKAMGDVPIVA